MNLTESELRYVRDHLPASIAEAATDTEVEDFYNKNKNLFLGIEAERVDAITNSKTINGALLKWNIKRDNSIYYCKTGDRHYGAFSPYQPIAEYIASEIGIELGLNIVVTQLEDVRIFDKNVKVSITKSFLREDEMYRSMRTFLTDKEIASQDLNEIIIKKFPCIEDSLYKMIAFDFLINNEDRHLNNFGFICNEFGEAKRPAPIFDNGNSLLMSVSSERFREPFERLDRESPSKPFRSKQYKQIKLIPREKKIYLENLNEIFNVIDSFEELPDRRKALIKNLLRVRNEYLKGLR